MVFIIVSRSFAGDRPQWHGACCARDRYFSFVLGDPYPGEPWQYRLRHHIIIMIRNLD
jgi:hypothetical protein